MIKETINAFHHENTWEQGVENTRECPPFLDFDVQYLGSLIPVLWLYVTDKIGLFLEVYESWYIFNSLDFARQP